MPMNLRRRSRPGNREALAVSEALAQDRAFKQMGTALIGTLRMVRNLRGMTPVDFPISSKNSSGIVGDGVLALMVDSVGRIINRSCICRCVMRRKRIRKC